MMPIIKFVSLEPGAMFCFRETDGIKTYDKINHEWIVPDKGMYPGSIFMMLDSPYEAYAKPTVEEIRVALKKELNELFRTVFSSVESGHLTIGYYHDESSIDDKIGYLHSASPAFLVYPFREKNIPPPWFNLKAFW